MSKINRDISGSSGYLGAIGDRSKSLYFSGLTVGQYQYECLAKNPHHSLKNEVFYRQDYLDEFERIWTVQASHHDKLNEKLKSEVRDIIIPKELQEAMAAEAIANRKKNARMVLAEAERDISEMLKDASDVYAEDAVAMKLRTMHLAYESVEKSGGTVVLPSAFSEGFVTDTAQTAQ